MLKSCAVSVQIQEFMLDLVPEATKGPQDGRNTDHMGLVLSIVYNSTELSLADIQRALAGSKPSDEVRIHAHLMLRVGKSKDDKGVCGMCPQSAEPSEDPSLRLRSAVLHSSLVGLQSLPRLAAHADHLTVCTE